MSSSLNLSPDLPVICVQAGFFLTNMFVIKKLILEPYLRVREARESATTGSLGSSEKLIQETKKMDADLSLKMQDAHKKAAKVREGLKTASLEKRAKKIAEAEAYSKSEVSKAQKEITQNLTEEKARKTESINLLAEEFVRSATH